MRQRPLSPHATVYRFQYTMIGSFAHRVSGLALSAGLLVFVAWLAAAAGGWGSYAVDVFFVKDKILLNYGPYVNQQLYFESQKPDFVPFPTARPDANPAYIGLTNQQLWDRYGVALGGKIAPASAVPAAGLVGLLGLPNA